MLFYYLVFIAILLFGVSFFFSDRYQQRCGVSFLSSVLFALGNSAAGGIGLLIVNGFSLHTTPFTLLMAFCFALCGVAMSVCTVISLEKVSLSLFSVFSMIGGMIVPAVVGILFYGEPLTVPKIVCYLLTLAGVALTVKKDGQKKAFLACLGVFLFNGGAAAASTIFAKADLARADSSDYSIAGALFKVLLVLVILPFAVRAEKKAAPADTDAGAAAQGIAPLRTVFGKYLRPAVLLLLVSGSFLNIVANWLLPLAMTDGGLDGSVVYPMITGGVMIVSTAFGYLNKKNKPTRKELWAVGICTLGLLVPIAPEICG